MEFYAIQYSADIKLQICEIASYLSFKCMLFILFSGFIALFILFFFLRLLKHIVSYICL